MSQSNSQKSNSQKMNPYDILGVSTDADQSTITKNYRKAMLKWHSDKFKPTSTNQADIEKEKQHAKDMHEKVSLSYEILSDNEKSLLSECIFLKLIPLEINKAFNDFSIVC